MSTRTSLRRKMVLAVMVIRHGGQEKQQAHTLDLTENSARLGGLVSPLEPGEIIELQRGGLKARFQVIWMGAPDGALAYQAGVRGLDTNKSIWNIQLPKDTRDPAVNIHNVRESTPVSTDPSQAIERRLHARYPCTGSASTTTAQSCYAMHGSTKDISKGGVYVEMEAPLPVNTKVNLDLCVEDIRFQATGVVRTSYPLTGMGIRFQELTAENSEKLEVAVERAKRKSGRQEDISPAQPSAQGSSVSTESVADDELRLRSKDYCAAISLLTSTSRTLVQGFHHWAHTCSPAQIEELHLTIDQLQQKLWAIQTEFVKPGPESVQADQKM